MKMCSVWLATAGLVLTSFGSEITPHVPGTPSRSLPAGTDPVIIHDGSNWTMVPAGSLIQLPASLRNRISTRPVGNLVSWKAFLRFNPSWIGGEEVSARQVSGRAVIDPRRLRYLARLPKIVVAVQDQEPVVLHPADPAVAVNQNR